MISIITLCVALAMAYAIWIAAGGIAPDVPLPEPPRPTVFPFVMMHRQDGGCGGRAFLLAARPEPYTVMRSHDAAYLNGRPMEHGSALICGTCGGRVRPFSANVISVTDVPDRDMGAA